MNNVNSMLDFQHILLVSCLQNCIYSKPNPLHFKNFIFIDFIGIYSLVYFIGTYARYRVLHIPSQGFGISNISHCNLCN